MAQVTLATQTAIANLYISILGRNPEAEGFGFWCDKLADAGNTPAAVIQIANGFGNSPEFIATYGGRTTTSAVTLMYNNVLNRAPDAGGLAYWTNVANTLIANGMSVSDAYAQTGNAIITVAGTNSSSDTALIVSKQNAAIASGTSGPTETFTLTIGVDTFVGSGGNDMFNGSVNGNGVATFQPFDTLIGGAGTDTLIAQGIGNLTTSSTTLQSIENINLYSMTAGATLNLGNTAGVVSVLVANNAGESSTVSGINAGVQSLAVTGNFEVGEVDSTTFSVTGIAAASSVSLTVDGVGDTDTTLNADNDTIIISNTTAGATGYQTINVAAVGSASFVTLDNAESTSLTTVNATGAVALTLDVSLTTATTINAAAMTGAFTVTAANGNNTITGGSGNDNFNLRGEYTTSDVINGGAGTNVLWLEANESNVTTQQTNVSNITKIRSIDAATAAINLSLFGATTTGLVLAAINNTGSVTYAAGTGTLEFGTVDQNESTFTANGNVVSTTDILNVTYGSTTAASIDIGKLNVNNFETVNVTIQGAAAAIVGNGDGIAVSPAPGSVLNVLGQFGGNLGLLTAATINASGMTLASTSTTGITAVLQTATFFTGSGGIDTITGSSSADRIVGGAGNDTLTTGGGNDILQGGLGVDTLNFTDEDASVSITLVTSAAESFVTTGGALTRADTLNLLTAEAGNTFTTTINTGVAATTVAVVSVLNLGTTTVSANGFLVLADVGDTAADINATAFSVYQDTNGNGLIDVNEFATSIVNDTAVDGVITLVGGAIVFTYAT